MNAIPPISHTHTPHFSDDNDLEYNLNLVATYCFNAYKMSQPVSPGSCPGFATLESLCPPNSSNATWVELESICPQTTNAQSQLNFLQQILQPPFNADSVFQSPGQLALAIATVLGSTP